MSVLVFGPHKYNTADLTKPTFGNLRNTLLLITAHIWLHGQYAGPTKCYTDSDYDAERFLMRHVVWC